MKKILFALFAIAAFAFTMKPAATGDGKGYKIPAATVKAMNGTKVNTADFSNGGKPIVISFWATWCAPCKKELENIAEVYEEWHKETGVKIIAISIDDARNSAKVPGYVKAKELPFDIYLDENQDFKRVMNVNNVPHTFLVDGTGNIVYDHNNYVEGDEDKLYEKIKELVK